jgi:hypothetical protein
MIEVGVDVQPLAIAIGRDLIVHVSAHIADFGNQAAGISCGA